MEDIVAKLNELDLRRKNALIIKSLFTTFVIGLAFQIALKMGMMLIAFQLIGGSFVGVIFFLHIKRKVPKCIPYISLVGLTIVSFGFLLASSSPVSILIIYYMIVNISVYMKRHLLIIAFVIGLIEHVYYLPVFGCGFSQDIVSFIIYVMYFFIIAIILYNKGKIAGYLVADIQASHMETEKLLQQEIERERALRTASQKINAHLGGIKDSSELNFHSLKEINSAFREIAAGAYRETEIVCDITKSTSSTYEMLEKMLVFADELSQNAQKANDESLMGANVINELSSTMNDFKSSTSKMVAETNTLIDKIDNIAIVTNDIRQIAVQTNLLSLNARIEAAKAGEQGKGFNIVAQEVGKLAYKTTELVEEISKRLSEITAQAKLTQEQMISNENQMKLNVESTHQTNKAFNIINSLVNELKEKTFEFNMLSKAIGNQAFNTQGAVNDFAAIIQQTTATIEELSATVEIQINKYNEVVDNIQDTNKQVNELMKLYKKV